MFFNIGGGSKLPESSMHVDTTDNRLTRYNIQIKIEIQVIIV
jgi:hypothetical protein